jgi:TRAP-type C4-dicarboxylate transport system permease small subunit
MTTVAKARGWFERALTFIIAFCLLALVAIDATLVVLRYAFNSGVVWSGEVGVLLMMTLAWTGLPLLWLKGGHIAIDLFGHSISPDVRRGLGLVLDVTFGVLAVILIVFALRAANAYSFIDMAVLPVSAAVKFWPIVAGATLSVAAVVFRLADRDTA